MPYPRKLQYLAADLQKPLPAIVEDYIARYKTPYYTAQKLGVHPNAIRYWLTKLGYVKEGKQWVKKSA